MKCITHVTFYILRWTQFNLKWLYLPAFSVLQAWSTNGNHDLYTQIQKFWSTTNLDFKCDGILAECVSVLFMSCYIIYVHIYGPQLVEQPGGIVP